MTDNNHDAPTSSQSIWVIVKNPPLDSDALHSLMVDIDLEISSLVEERTGREGTDVLIGIAETEGLQNQAPHLIK